MGQTSKQPLSLVREFVTALKTRQFRSLLVLVSAALPTVVAVFLQIIEVITPQPIQTTFSLTAPLTIAIAIIVVAFKREPPKDWWEASTTIALVLAAAALVSLAFGIGPKMTGASLPLSLRPPWFLIPFWIAWLFIAAYFQSFGAWRFFLSVVVGISLGFEWIKLTPKSDQAAG